LSYPWQAVFAICKRDPWPGCDEVLVEQFENSDEAYRNQAGDVGTVGAAAAACLVLRHDLEPASFGLRPVEQDGDFFEVGVVGYRFTSSEGARAVLSWWESQKKAARPTVSRLDEREARVKN
jgi:hypothetical protein